MLSNLLLALPTLFEIFTDTAEFRKDLRDKKGQDVIVRSLLIVFVALIDSLFINKGVSFWQSLTLSFGIFVMFFDYAMGMILTKNPFFLGTTSQTDRFWSFVPWYCGILVRGMVFAITVIIYEYLDILKLLFNLI